MRKFSKCKWINEKLQVFWTVNGEKKEVNTLFRANGTGYAAFGWGYKMFLNSSPVVVLRDQDGKVFQRRFHVRSVSGFDAMEPVERYLRRGDYRNGFVMALFQDSFNRNEHLNTLHAVWGIGSAYDFRFLQPPSESNRGVVKIML